MKKHFFVPATVIALILAISFPANAMKIVNHTGEHLTNITMSHRMLFRFNCFHFRNLADAKAKRYIPGKGAAPCCSGHVAGTRVTCKLTFAAKTASGRKIKFCQLGRDHNLHIFSVVTLEKKNGRYYCKVRD